MISAAKLAGELAAHGIWCVFDGAVLIPMLGFVGEDGARNMVRLVFEDMAMAVKEGQQRLDVNEMDADDAVLIYDGRITLDAGKVDALIIELRAYFMPDSRASLIVPYTPKAAGGFAVHKPKLIEWVGCGDFDLDAFLESFFTGVDSHKEGSKLWEQHFDGSI